MKLDRMIIIAAFMAVATSLCAAEAAPTPQTLYLQAGRAERSGSAVKAREIYESIIDRFPESEFAVKANDRLLILSAPAKADSETGGVTAEPEKPLPDDPRLRKAVEAARLKSKAEVTAREEFERLKRVDDAREGRKQNRSRVAEKEQAWHQAAERKVIEKHGISLGEISSRLDSVCREAGLPTGCSEDDLLKVQKP